MQKNSKDKDWVYYLDTYGSDLSRWPSDALQSIDVEGFEETKEFQHAQKLDEKILSFAMPKPSSNLKEKLLEITSQSNLQAHPSHINSQWKPVIQGILIAAIMISSLFFGVRYGETINNHEDDYSDTMTKIWYFGPIYAYADTN